MPNPPKSLKGKRFGLLVVQRQVGRSPSGISRWECQCDCGTVKSVLYTNLTQGRTRSCGCFKKS